MKSEHETIKDFVEGMIIVIALLCGLMWFAVQLIDHLPPSPEELRGEVKMGPVK